MCGVTVYPCRNLVGEDEDVETGLKSLQEVGFINYYGLQRFGTQSVCTHHVGRLVPGCCCMLWLHGVSKWCTCWTVGCLYAVQLLHGVVRIGTAALCVVWSGLVQLCFVWCLSVCCSVITHFGWDWYSCALCGVCLYAVQLSRSVVRTGIAILCVVSVCCSVITQCVQDWYSYTVCGVCMLLCYHTVWSGLV